MRFIIATYSRQFRVFTARIQAFVYRILLEVRLSVFDQGFFFKTFFALTEVRSSLLAFISCQKEKGACQFLTGISKVTNFVRNHPHKFYEITLSISKVDLDFKLSPCVECRIVIFFGGNLPASQFLVQTFRNLLSVPSS